MRRLAPVLIATALPMAAHAEGMPQLDFGNPLLTAQVVWGALIFFVFYLAVSRYGLPQVGAILEAREQSISADLEQARTAKEKADRAVAELTEARRLAHAESQTALAAATQKAKDEAASRAAALNDQLDAKLRESEARIATARANAMGALRGVAAETAVAVVARLTGKPADEARVQAAVDAALAERGLAA